MIATLAGHLPAPPLPAPPILWGDEAHVRNLLGGQTLLAMERRTIDFVHDSADAIVGDYERRFGPVVLAQKILDAEAYDALKSDLRTLVEEFDRGEGEVRLAAEYLLVVGLRP
jgi:hypothetical protein